MSKHMRYGRFGVLALVGALSFGLTGCDDLLDVTDPDIVTPGSLTGPAGIAAVRAGAIGDFAFAYAGNAGGTEGQILVSGMMTDEYYHSGTFVTRREFDIRNIDEDNGTLTGVFQNLARARQSLETAASTIENSVESPSSDGRIGEMLGLAGYTYIMFGENYCSGVPITTLDEAGQLVPGEPLTTEEIFNRAIQTFQSASSSAAGSSALQTLATIGQARALLNLGDVQAAASAVSGVPTDYEFLIEYSTNTGRQENGVHNFNTVFERWSVANNDGGNGLAFRESMDPRVPWERTPADDLGFDEVTPQYNLLKYPSRDSPIALATGEEARLIEAEAALASGDVDGFLSNLNEVRARYDLDDVADPGTADGRVDLLFQERAFTLFGTSHRLGDLRRMIRQYGRTEADIFPTGAYHKPSAGSFGNDVNVPVPFQEENNPNFEGCLNRDA